MVGWRDLIRSMFAVKKQRTLDPDYKERQTMATAIIYKYDQFLTKSDDEKFDKIYEPGTPTPYSGIYRCEGCGKEATSVHPPSPAAAKPSSAHCRARKDPLVSRCLGLIYEAYI